MQAAAHSVDLPPQIAQSAWQDRTPNPSSGHAQEADFVFTKPWGHRAAGVKLLLHSSGEMEGGDVGLLCGWGIRVGQKTSDCFGEARVGIAWRWLT